MYTISKMCEDFAACETQYLNDSQLKSEDVAKLEEWQRLQPHLPKPLHPIETALFLHSCYYNNEAAKQCIETFYTYRTHCPEFFGKCDPLEREVRQALDTFLCVVLPDLTPDGSMVIYGRLRNDDPSAFHFSMLTKVYDMVTQLAIKQRGCANGHIGIFDMCGASIKHLIKINLLSVKKSIDYLQKGQPIRLKSIHIVNAMPLVDKVMAMTRPFLKKELIDVQHVHTGNNATIFSFVPKDILPIECGGSKFSAIDYYENVTRKNLEMHSDYFKLMETRLVDESKRLGAPKNGDNLFGAEGTFKNINID